MASFNLWTLISVAFLAYISHSIWSLYGIYNPSPCTPAQQKASAASSAVQCISAYRERVKEPLQLRIIASLSPSIRKGGTEVARFNDIIVDSEWEREVDVELPVQTRKNGSLFLHLFLLPVSEVSSALDASWYVHDVVPATRYELPQAEAFKLISSNTTETKTTPSGSAGARPVTHFRSHLPLMIVADDFSFNVEEIPGEIARMLKLNNRNEYYPIFRADELSFRVRDLVQVKEDTTSVKLKVHYRPVSTGKLRMLLVAQQSVEQMKSLGFTDKDVDEVKGIFTDTNFYFLALTFFVAAVHLLLDFLAIKNDVRFWRNRKTLVGLSARTVVWNSLSHTIIFVYLYDQETSLLVLIPAGISVAIEFWKVVRMLRMRKRLGTNSALLQEEDTEAFDSQGMKYLTLLLVPLCVGGAIYSLLYTPHKSWLSWIIQCLANGVYAFGFLFMLPQLFINYKLKSVAHLPWRAFMYKAFNTFIDDMFAFIIRMPTAHRLACFRDDIVFVVYLYQRWLYPVDRTRVNEFGESFEQENAEKRAEPKKTK